MKNINCEEGGLHQGKLWKMKKKLSPRLVEPPSGKRDRGGNLITHEESLKNLYIETYKERLTHRKIKEGLEDLELNKNQLFEQRIAKAKSRVTEPWTKDQLLKVLKSLKKGKARDPWHLCNEIFRPEVAGDDLIEALLLMFNHIKKQQIIPDVFKHENITSIYKGKGSKHDLVNDRGIFGVVVFRSILDKLIYNDEYEKVDASMTDSNVGARKERNIRDNLFVVNGVINSVMNKEIKNIDCQLFDISQCFDSLWLQETMNDIYEGGLDNDKFVLLYEENKKNLVAIRTAYGLTDRFELDEIVMQGTVFGPLKCTTQMDKLGGICYGRGNPLLMYKKTVQIPPLGMIDDLLVMNVCGSPSIISNSVVNTFIESKRLQFSEKKCAKIHVGESSGICPELKVHDKQMLSSDRQKYVGDIISSDGKNTEHIAERTSRGWAIVAEILSILREIPLGKYKIETGLLLRKTMFLNGILTSMETRYGLKNDEIKSLEKIDEHLLKKILSIPSKSPSYSLYVDTGALKIPHILMTRRLMFLHHILTRNKKELISRVYYAQKRSPAKNDWFLTVQKDKEEAGILLSDDIIKSMKKNKFRDYVKERIAELAFNTFMQDKMKHSKGKETIHSSLSMQKYCLLYTSPSPRDS